MIPAGRFVPFFLAFLPLLVGAAAGAAGERFQVPLAASPVRGPAAAPVTIIEFLDFQ